MKSERRFPGVKITKKAEISIKNGHPWVYGEEITEGADALSGQLYADVFSQKGSYLGTGFVSEKSKIRIRILSDNANETFSDAFFFRSRGFDLQHHPVATVSVRRDHPFRKQELALEHQCLGFVIGGECPAPLSDTLPAYLARNGKRISAIPPETIRRDGYGNFFIGLEIRGIEEYLELLRAILR